MSVVCSTTNTHQSLLDNGLTIVARGHTKCFLLKHISVRSSCTSSIRDSLVYCRRPNITFTTLKRQLEPICSS